MAADRLLEGQGFAPAGRARSATRAGAHADLTADAT